MGVTIALRYSRLRYVVLRLVTVQGVLRLVTIQGALRLRYVIIGRGIEGRGVADWCVAADFGSLRPYRVWGSSRQARPLTMPQRRAADGGWKSAGGSRAAKPMWGSPCENACVGPFAGDLGTYASWPHACGRARAKAG
jgi:hypothetical protein